MSLRLTQGDENQGQIEWYRRVFLALPQRIGCPILRAFCEGWDKQKLRGRASGEEQWHPTLRKKHEGWGTRSFVAGQESNGDPRFFPLTHLKPARLL